MRKSLEEIQKDNARLEIIVKDVEEQAMKKIMKLKIEINDQMEKVNVVAQGVKTQMSFPDLVAEGEGETQKPFKNANEFFVECYNRSERMSQSLDFKYNEIVTKMQE